MDEKPIALLGLHSPGESNHFLTTVLNQRYSVIAITSAPDGETAPRVYERFLTQLREGVMPSRIIMDLNLGQPYVEDLSPLETTLQILHEKGLPKTEARRRVIGITGTTPLVPIAIKKGYRALSKPFRIFDLLEDYVHFCTPEEAKGLILHDPDDFFNRLTPMDLTIRGAPDPYTLQQRVKESVQEWTKDEMATLRPNLEAHQKLLRERYPNLDFPGIVYLIKTDGTDEGNLYYVRGNSIVIPASRIDELKNDPYMADHENGHLLARYNPELVRRAAEQWGYTGHPLVRITDQALLNHLVTNPDVTGAYTLTLTHKGNQVLVLPVIYFPESNPPGKPLKTLLDERRLQLRLLQVELAEGGVLQPALVEGNPQFCKLGDLQGIHPGLAQAAYPADAYDEVFADLIHQVLEQPKPSTGFLQSLDTLLRTA